MPPLLLHGALWLCHMRLFQKDSNKWLYRNIDIFVTQGFLSGNDCRLNWLSGHLADTFFQLFTFTNPQVDTSVIKNEHKYTKPKQSSTLKDRDLCSWTNTSKNQLPYLKANVYQDSCKVFLKYYFFLMPYFNQILSKKHQLSLSWLFWNRKLKGMTSRSSTNRHILVQKLGIPRWVQLYVHCRGKLAWEY